MSDTLIFELTPHHIKLLSRMYVTWYDAEFGAPAIDPKRPYGNSDVIGDMFEIVTGMVPHDDEDDYDDRLYASEYRRLHEETKTALQIVLCTKSFVPGKYIKLAYDAHSWTLMSPSN